MDLRVLGGILLILIGGLILLQTTNVLSGNAGNAIWAVAFGAAGGFLIYFYSRHKSQWWALIPGIALLGIALSNVLHLAFPRADDYDGLIVLGSIGLSFLMIYLNNRSQWWAVIPAGALLSLGVIDVLDEFAIPGFDTDGILFLGMGLTFLLLSIIPTSGGRLKWGIYPAIPLLLFGIFLSFKADQYLNYVWPALIILVGLYVLVKTLARR
jgi:hypothetical protein